MLSLGLAAALAPESPGPLPSSAAPGDHIGRYKLLELIGEGGFGNVWMAEQQEPVRRKVALKILKLGMDTREVVARFEAERQALAMMDHANIAKVLDAGATEQGRPFFVMELVAGVPITTFCDTHQLDTRQRIELFVLVCEAVQHAHQKGVIHRDLKPGNILVSEQDGRFVPKVIDFGVAKALEEPLTDKTFFTRYHQFLGTPVYMSPEQAGLGGLDVDTRSDIYSLGVLLYELLTGRTPFTNEQLRKAQLDEVLRVIREQEPPKPSTRLTEDLAADDLRRRSSSQSGEFTSSRQRLQELVGLLRGELDWIILKALDKDRARRYATANGFAAELRRYLNGEVVTAAPPTVAYRLQKAWHRHKLIFTAAAAVAASLLIGLGVSTWLFVKETRAYREARAAEAEQSRLRALEERTAADLRESLYASEMNVAFHALRDGRVVLTRELLDKQRPQPGEPDLRGFEWRYLWKHSRANELFTLTNAAMWGLALSPDGQTVAGFSVDRAGLWRVGLWNVTTRQLFSVLDPEPEHLFSLAFSPDGRTLAAAHCDQHYVKLWDVANRKQIGQLNTAEPLIGVAFSPDGKTIVTTGGWMYQYDAVGEVVLWDTATMQKIRPLIGSRFWAYQATFAPDGQTLAASDGAGVVNLWKVATGELITRLPGHNGFVEPVTFSRDGEILAAGDQQGYVWLWNWRARRVESVFRAHDLPIYTILFSPDEKRLITASRDQTARMWDRQTRREIARFTGHTGGVTAAQLFPDGQTLVTSSQDGTLKFWDARNRFSDDVLGTHTEMGVDLAFTSNGHYLARAEPKKTNITFFATETGVPVQVLSGQGVAASQDGKLLSLVRDSKLIFLDPVTLVETGSMDLGAPLGASAVSPDGKLIAVRRRDSAATNVVILDAKQHREVTVFPTPDDEWAPLQFARQGTLLLTAGKTANTISAWDTRSWRKVAAFEGIEWTESRSMAAIAVSPDGNTIAAGGKGESVLVWDVDRPSNPTVLNTGAGQAFSSAFSPDGKTLAIGSLDASIRLWNVAARQEVAVFVGHSSYIDCVAFAPDGRTLASISYDKTLRIWRAPSFEEIAAAETDRLRSPQP